MLRVTVTEIRHAPLQMGWPAAGLQGAFSANSAQGPGSHWHHRSPWPTQGDLRSPEALLTCRLCFDSSPRCPPSSCCCWGQAEPEPVFSVCGGSARVQSPECGPSQSIILFAPTLPESPCILPTGYSPGMWPSLWLKSVSVLWVVL